MNSKTFSVGAWMLSAAGTVLGGLLLTPNRAQALDTPLQRILWCGIFFPAVFLCGFLGLSLWARWNRTCKVVRPRGWPAVFLASAVLLGAVGAGGEALFMYTKEQVSVSAEVDMVLLLDASGSMDSAGYSHPRTQAACQFVDGLSGDCRAQAVSFAAVVLDRSPLSLMDDSGKAAVKDFIQGIDSVGSTDFNDPLQVALDTLRQEGREGCHYAVFLLTDGEGDLSDEVVRTYLDSGIRVFTIRIGASGASSGQAKALTDFAQSTGGFDVCLTPGANGEVETSELLASFRNAFQAVRETRTAMSEDLLLQGGHVSLYQFLVRLAVLMVCSALFGIGYFGRLQWPALGLNLACGLVLDVAFLFLGAPGYAPCILLLCVLIGPALVRLKWEGGEVIHV